MQRQKLMAQADAQHRNGRIKTLQKFRAKSGMGRMAGAGRNADHTQPRICGRLQHGGIVVVQNARRVPQGVKSLYQIIGEGIVIIYKQKHILRPPPARPGA